MNRILKTTLALVCAALAWWSWQLHSQVAELTRENADLRPKLEKALQAARDSTMDSGRLRSREDVAAAPAADAPADEVDGSTAPKPASKRNFHPEEITAMVQNPAMQSVIASQQSALLQMTYRDLLQRFKLSPEESDYMQKLLLERQMNLVTLGMQFMNPELSPEQRGALGLQIRDAEQSSQAKIRAFLNDENDYAYYQRYAGQEPERREVGMFESSLAGSEPLEPAKADALASLMNETRKKYPFTVDFYDQSNFARPQVLNQASVNKFLEEQTQYQAELAQQAADLLSPGQLAAFRQSQAATRQMTKMQLNSVLQMAGSGQ